MLGAITLLKGLGEMFEAEAILEGAANDRAAENNAARDGGAMR